MKDVSSAAKTSEKSAARPQPANTAPNVQMDCSRVHGSYANVCNVSSTREEVVLAFGVNNAWEQGQVQIQMTDRIVLNPHAAKRLAEVLNRVVAEYENRFGPLKVETKPEVNAA